MVSLVRLRVFPVLALAVLASACAGGTETGNPPLQVKLSYAAYSSDPSVGIREAAEVATVSSVWLTLAEVGFTPGSGCDDQNGTFRAPAIGVGDHAGGVPVTTQFALEPGAYCAVALPFTLAEELPAEAPASLLGASVLITGTLAAGTAFTIESRTATSFVLQPDTGTFVLERAHADTLLGFDVSAWLAYVDWASAESGSDGIVISAERNSALLARFEANLPRGVRLFRDRDGDGRLDPNAELLAEP
jgi:hypothetical protein